ncbi:MAG: tetratricopeptide repeat protein [Candidatus Thorarchaeota archaeon]|nr:tetratricopeptide repeat protein [Candidatus Thorarchaeota archaeon]
MQTKEFDRAIEALEDQRFKEATVILEDLVETNGNDPELLVYLGLAYLQNEQPRKAIDVLLVANEQIENHCVVAQFLGRAYKAIRDYDCAETYLKQAISADPELYEAWLDLAEVLYFTKQYGEAARILEEAVVRFPEDPALHSLRAMSFYRLGDYTEAARAWGAVSALRPESIVALANYGYSLLFVGRIDDAKNVIDKAKEMAPDHYRTIMLEGEMAFQMRNYKTAHNAFTKALHQCPTSIEALSRLAVITYQLHDEIAAEGYLNRAKRLVEEEPTSWQRLCNVHVLLKKFDDLLHCLNMVIEEDTTSAAAWIALAIEETRRGHSEEAKVAWVKSIKLRGYIKTYCPQCNQHMRIPVVNTAKVNLDIPVYCVYCDRELALPEHLSTV